MRITGGRYRSRGVGAPRGTSTRPTSDRVREALFGILESAKVVKDARVLDLYAGTGALGLEALSRGAAHATFVESAREALEVLRANVASLDLEDRARIVAGGVAPSVRRLKGSAPFDLVLADPPWALADAGARGEVPAVLAALVRAHLLGPSGWIVLEHSARTAVSGPSAVPGLAVFDVRRYGDTALTFYKPDILAPLSH